MHEPPWRTGSSRRLQARPVELGGVGVAQGGRFIGRWDDPAGEWRAIYVGATRVACYLEVLASFRPDPTLEAEMGDIDSDDDADEFPTISPGRLDYGWCESDSSALPGCPGASPCPAIMTRFRLCANSSCHSRPLWGWPMSTPPRSEMRNRAN